MIPRTIENCVKRSVKQWPVTLITGARQIGKSTLCSLIMKELGFNYVSLDNTRERNAALTDPAMFLKLHPAPLIIDEVQYAPCLFEEIESIVNEEKFNTGSNYGMYILTGSHAYRLMEGVTESLAGRVNIISMNPLSTSEIYGKEEKPFTVDLDSIQKRVQSFSIDPNELYNLTVRGMFPELHHNPEKETEEFYRNYVDTYLERDVSLLINVKDKKKFHDFLSILASLTGQELVYDSIANTIGVTAKTIKSWVSVLETGNIITLLQPYYDTFITKRIVNRPKLYFNDTGLACYLIGLPNAEVLSKSIFRGRIVETYIVNEIMKSYSNNCTSCRFYYYRDSNKNEIDLIILKDAKAHLVECKSGISFDRSDVKAFKNMKTSCYEIGESCIICNTDVIYPIEEGVYALPITSI